MPDSVNGGRRLPILGMERDKCSRPDSAEHIAIKWKTEYNGPVLPDMDRTAASP